MLIGTPWSYDVRWQLKCSWPHCEVRWHTTYFWYFAEIVDVGFMLIVWDFWRELHITSTSEDVLRRTELRCAGEYDLTRAYYTRTRAYYARTRAYSACVFHENMVKCSWTHCEVRWHTTYFAEIVDVGFILIVWIFSGIYPLLQRQTIDAQNCDELIECESCVRVGFILIVWIF